MSHDISFPKTKRIVVTGADTDAGKTYATCQLIAAARQLGYVCHPFKPIMTGFDEQKETQNSDAALLANAAGLHSTNAETITRISPYRFKEPQSPDVAAYLEQKPCVTARMLADAIPTTLPPNHIAIIEAIGGVCVPLNANETTLDLFTLWPDAFFIFVAPCRLGGLSACLTGVAAAKRANIAISAVVVTHPKQHAGEVDAHLFKASLAPHLQETPLFDLRLDMQALCDNALR